MTYTFLTILDKKLGNNIFAWDIRASKYQKNPTLAIPSCLSGSIDDVRIGQDIVFEEVENETLRSCHGLENFVRLSDTIVVFDNHNHALYFWLESIKNGIIAPGFELIHIDEHSDLWENEYSLDLKKAIENPQYAWDFTNLSCNVGNYIQPALQCGLIGTMIRIENEYQIDEYQEYIPSENSILNLDLDIFAPELDHIPEDKKLQIIKNLIQRVKYVTIATSPYFIDQGKALEMLRKILQKSE